MKAFQREITDEIKMVTLVSGGPIIAKVSTNMGNLEDDYYILEDPFSVVWSESTDKNKGPKFTVFDVLALSSDTQIEVATKHVLFFHTPLPEIVDQYNTMLLNNLTPISDND